MGFFYFLFWTTHTYTSCLCYKGHLKKASIEVFLEFWYRCFRSPFWSNRYLSELYFKLPDFITCPLFSIKADFSFSNKRKCFCPLLYNKKKQYLLMACKYWGNYCSITSIQLLQHYPSFRMLQMCFSMLVWLLTCWLLLTTSSTCWKRARGFQ